jgi:hypothetical protein
MGVGYCKPNCIHFDNWSCNKKPKVFFGLFRAECVDRQIGGYQACNLHEPHPRPTHYPPPPLPQSHLSKPSVCDVCGRIMNKDW